jgi:protein O-GlcNAc transferase
MDYNVQQIFNDALSALNNRNVQKAEGEFRRVIELEPSHVPALNLLTIVLMSTGRLREAELFIARAVDLNQNSDVSFYNYGLIAKQLHKPELAYEQFTKALQLNPNVTETWNNRGTVCNDLEKYEMALTDFDKALEVNQNFAEAYANKGKSLSLLKRYDESFAAYDKALSIKPNLAEAWLGCGNVFWCLERYDEAFAAYDKALSIKPDLADAWLGRGNVLTNLKRYGEAFAAYDKALSIKPDSAEAWLGCGNVFTELKRYGEAFAAYDKAVSIKPDSAEAWLGRGNVFTGLKRYDEAFAAYDRALSIKPDLKTVEGARLHSKIHLCDWTELEAETAQFLTGVREQTAAGVPFALLPLPCTAADQMRCAERYVKGFPAYSPVWLGETYSHDRIRVAYLSADFRNHHPVAQLTAGLFEYHDKSRFEITGISIGPTDDSPLRRRLENAFEHFIDANDKTDADIANLIRDREIDIAVDLMGHTQDSRLGILARRPAPIQVHYLGYAGTLGANYIDYIVADSIVVPEEHRQFFTEQVVWLPDCYLASDDRRAMMPHTPTRRECGLPEDGFVFCSFNNSYKIAPTMFRIWMRVLQATPNSVLWLRQAGPITMSNLRREAERHGVSAQRLVFAPGVAHNADHLARQRQADLFLDTLPYNAHTTASDALWAGLPVLTCLGETFAGRVAASLLKAIDLPELITLSPEEYEALAIELALNKEKLQRIREKLARNRLTTPLFDTPLYTKHLEAAYKAMHHRYQAGLPPDHIRANRADENQAQLADPIDAVQKVPDSLIGRARRRDPRGQCASDDGAGCQ